MTPPAFLVRVEATLGPLPPRAVHALRTVPRGAFLPASLGPLAGADAPLPFLGVDEEAALTPSPRVVGLLLQLLELDDGLRVLVVGAESGYLAALCLEAGAAAVRVVEPDRAALLAAQAYVEGAGYADRVSLAAGPPAKEAGAAPWDRLLLLDPRRTLTQPLAARLADLGFALQLVHTRQGWEVVKTLRSGPDQAEIRAPDLALPGGLPGAAASLFPDLRRGTLTGLLALEEMCCNVWRGRAPSAAERSLKEGVEDTWRRPPGDLGALPPAVRERRALAQRVFHLGYLAQAAGDLDLGADLYQRSLAVLPSAEAHTFLGWTRAHQGRLEEAMACCHRAIAEDPSLGNPYNDIGAYLLQLGREDEAQPWFERALQAARYEAPFFPHLNLARVHLAKGRADDARAHLQKVLDLNPGYPPALELLRRLDGTGA